MKTVCVINNKGGVGKSATTFETASAFKKKGLRTLIVDLDEQSSVTWQIYGRKEAGKIKTSVADVVTGKADIKDAILKTQNFDLLAGSPDTRALDKQLPKPSDMFNLKKQLDAIAVNYDACFVDEPAHLGACAYLGTFATTGGGGVLIPVEPDVTTIQGAVLINDFLEENKIFINDLKILGLLKIRFRNYNFHKESGNALDSVAKTLNVKVYDTNIRECTALREAKSRRMSVFDYKPKSNAAADYNAFADELITQLNLK